MKIVARMGHWSSVVGGGVLLACTYRAAALRAIVAGQQALKGQTND